MRKTAARQRWSIPKNSDTEGEEVARKEKQVAGDILNVKNEECEFQ